MNGSRVTIAAVMSEIMLVPLRRRRERLTSCCDSACIDDIETGAAMNTFRIMWAFVALASVAGCQSQSQMLADEQTVAIQAAVRRGQFELACPNATGTVLSSNFLQPVLYGGLERAEYTIGVAGCGKRAVYVSVCQVGSVACFAAGTSGGDVISRFQGGG